MLYAVGLHFFAGSVAGSVLTVRALVPLLAFLVIESAALSVLHGTLVGLTSLSSLVAIEMGYLAGVLARGVLEPARLPDVEPHSGRIP